MTQVLSAHERESSARRTFCKAVYPDARGRFGPFGGRYVPEMLVPALDRLEAGVKRYLRNPDFLAEFEAELRSWVGQTHGAHARTHIVETVERRRLAEARRPRPHRRAQDQQLDRSGVAREEARGRSESSPRRALASMASRQPPPARGLACLALCIWDPARTQRAGAERRTHETPRGDCCARDERRPDVARAAVDEALRDWVSDPNGTYYRLGSAIGPHPYPYIVRELQSVIGLEAREQIHRGDRQVA